MNKFIYFKILALQIILMTQIHQIVAQNSEPDSLQDYFSEVLDNYINTPEFRLFADFHDLAKIKTDSIFYVEEPPVIKWYLSKEFAHAPWRENLYYDFYTKIQTDIPWRYRDFFIEIFAGGILLQNCIPDFFRNEFAKEFPRKINHTENPQVVRRKKAFEITNGLQNNNIALWNSHGWYFEQELNRWEWERARLFTTVEDLLPTSFVLQFIVPMLENAGANVFLPRERDTQTYCTIVDNDSTEGLGQIIMPKSVEFSTQNTGFAIGNVPYTNENPFRNGSFGILKNPTDRVTWIPDIPENGYYSVYISYGEADADSVEYQVFYKGGTQKFYVNQQRGYSTWIHLGQFYFEKGTNFSTGRVVLCGSPLLAGKKVTFDATRFGGGVGKISRNGQSSNRPAFMEAARYYLQYAGAVDSLTWAETKGIDDYKDDYKSRGKWVNYLKYGTNPNDSLFGLNIPIDCSFAFHTDAGIATVDSVIGTLAIYSTENNKGYFSDSTSRMISRELTDIIQTQIVNDIRTIYNFNWTRRGLWNKQYSEAFEADVPTMLLELLSHQSFNDMKFALNPKFRFDVSRAIYKAMLKFLAFRARTEYVVQPLPVNNVYAEFQNTGNLKISWKDVKDSLEPTAIATGYIVYQRIGNEDFDTGTFCEKPEIEFTNISEGLIYSFKITAINSGGESFPSEIISVGKAKKSKGNILIINGFDRIDAPAYFETDSLAAFVRQLDAGVAWGTDLITTGDQYDFYRNSPWTDDDAPGHGASFANLETKIITGNTFDFAKIHGEAMLFSGWSFVTASDEAVENKHISINNYIIIDWLLGEEKTSKITGDSSKTDFSIYNEEMISALETYLKNNGKLLLSGAYIGTDIGKNATRIRKLLKFTHRSNHAVVTGTFCSVNKNFSATGSFVTNIQPNIYPVEAPDAIEPVKGESEMAFRYTENNTGAGVCYKGSYSIVALGFPFECIENTENRNSMMLEIIEFLNKK